MKLKRCDCPICPCNVEAYALYGPGGRQCIDCSDGEHLCAVCALKRKGHQEAGALDRGFERHTFRLFTDKASA